MNNLASKPSTVNRDLLIKLIKKDSTYDKTKIGEFIYQWLFPELNIMLRIYYTPSSRKRAAESYLKALNSCFHDILRLDLLIYSKLVNPFGEDCIGLYWTNPYGTTS